MIRLLVFLAIAAGLTYCGATVKLGEKTFFQHLQAIGGSKDPEELGKGARELGEGVKEKAGPAARSVKRGLEKGIEAATEEDAGSGSGSAARKPAPAPARP